MNEDKNIFKVISMQLLSLCIVIPFISTIGFLININISKYHFIVGFLISVLMVFLIFRDYGLLIKSTVISIVVIAFSIALANGFYDVSYDGMHYHLSGVLELVNGWNPIYNLLEDTWTNNLVNSFAAKSVWYTSASIVKMTGSMATGKAYQTIAFFMVFLGALNFLYEKNLNRYFKFILSLLIACNPVYLYQLSSNYADYYTYAMLVMLVFSLVIVDENREFIFYKPIVLVIASTIAILCNIKFTGIFFAGIFYGLFWIKWGIQLFKSTSNTKLVVLQWLKLSVDGLLGLILAFVIGINPYITNLINGKNMFHPMLGSNSIELMGNNIPSELQGKNTIYKFIHNLLSGNDGILKNPFKFTQADFNNPGVDIRHEGFGILFPAILILVILLFGFYLWKIGIKEDYKSLLFLQFTLLLIAVVFPESWWARYYAIFWIFPIILLVILLNENKRILNLAATCIVICLIVNCIIVSYIALKYTMPIQKSWTNALQEIKNENVIVYTDSRDLWERSSIRLLNENKVIIVDIIEGTPSRVDFDFYFFKVNKVDTIER